MPLAAIPVAVSAAVGAAAAIGGAAFSVIGGLSQASKQKKAMRQAQAAEAEQQRIQQAQADAAAQRERIQQQREARIRRASVINATANTGAGFSGTSGLVGAESSIQSQLGYNIGTINQTQSFAAQISAANQREQDALGAARKAETTGQAWQNIGSSIFHVGSIGSKRFGGAQGAGMTFPNFFATDNNKFL
jgi:hypothetical protein